MTTTLFKETIVKQHMPDDEYRSYPAISQSELKHMLKSPAHYKANKESVHEETDAMRLGTATHLAVFQLEHFHNEVALAPKFDKRTKDGKAGWEKFQQENSNKILLTEEDYAKCIGMADSVRSSARFQSYISSGSPEVSFFSKTSYGIDVKGRLDWINFKTGTALDLKTLGKEASEYEIKKTIRSRLYDFQNGFYNNFLKSAYPDQPFNFIFIFVESSAPHGVRFVTIDPAHLLNVDALIDLSLRDLKKANETGIFTSYNEDVNVISF
jgi:hypothetical protein